MNRLIQIEINFIIRKGLTSVGRRGRKMGKRKTKEGDRRRQKKKKMKATEEEKKQGNVKKRTKTICSYSLLVFESR